MKLKITIQAALAVLIVVGPNSCFFGGSGGESGDLPPRIQDVVVTKNDLKKT